MPLQKRPFPGTTTADLVLLHFSCSSRCIEKGYDCAYRVAGSPRLSEGPTPSPPAGLSSPSGAPGTIFLVNGSLQSSPESTVTLPTKVNACYRCRKHRRRCSGGSPCKRCVQDHAECLASAPHLKRQSKKTVSSVCSRGCGERRSGPSEENGSTAEAKAATPYPGAPLRQGRHEPPG